MTDPATERAVPSARAREPRDVERFLARALERAARERAIAVVRVPAPLAPIDVPLTSARRTTAVCWQPPEGPPVAAIGRAAEIELSGPDRFAALERASDALFSQVLARAHADAPDAPPRLFGGWAFAEGGADRAPWEGFGDGRFVLPRWSYEHRGGTGVLTLALDLRDGWSGRIALARSELSSLRAWLASPPTRTASRRAVRARATSRSSWDALVGSITEAVRAGRLEKAVASRCVELRSDRDLDAWSILRRASARYPSTFRFGFRFGDATFLGATPERLFAKRGRALVTEAVAGSIATGAPDAERALALSDKDRREHSPVVRHVLARLAPLCEALEAAPEPAIRRLPNVLHLHTPISGTLRAGVSAAALAAALHPTPAVGGVPAEAALAHIAAHEPHARGWYAGPIGWIDARGDAELGVALRSGLVRGASAWIYAGAGIVEGSEPGAEWEETELKLRPLREAIGGRG